VQFWAQRTWCWGFCYCIVTLLCGAFVSATLVPVTESCQLLTELKRDSNAVDNFGSVVDDKEQAKKLVQGCLISDSGEPELLMDIMGTMGGANNETFVALRTKLAEDVSKTVEGLFSELKESAEAPYNGFHGPMMVNLFGVFERDEETLKSSLPNSEFSCPVFEDAFGNDCDTKDWTANCLSNSAGSDYAAMKMKKKERTCTKVEYVAYLKEFWSGGEGPPGRLEVPLQKLDQKIMMKKNRIMTSFEKVWDAHIGGAVAELSDKTDCRYIGIYYKQLVGGLCAQTVVGINDMVSASLLSGYFSVALTIAMYLLWRMALDNYDHHADLAPEEARKALEEEERLRAEADRAGWVLTSGMKDEDKAIDPNLIPESVRQRQMEIAEEPFD